MEIKLGMIIGGLLIVGQEDEAGNFSKAYQLQLNKTDGGVSVGIFPMFTPFSDKGADVKSNVIISTTKDFPPSVMQEYQRITSDLIIPNAAQANTILRGK